METKEAPPSYTPHEHPPASQLPSACPHPQASYPPPQPSCPPVRGGYPPPQPAYPPPQPAHLPPQPAYPPPQPAYPFPQQQQQQQQQNSPIVINNLVGNQQAASPVVVVQNPVQKDVCLSCSILNLIFCGLLCGSIAVAFSCMAREAYDRGDVAAGDKYMIVVRVLNTADPLVIVIFMIVSIVTSVT